MSIEADPRLVPPRTLPVIGSCDGCGACCRVVTLPPFRRDFDEAGEDAWERLRWERPDLMAGFLAASRALRASGGPSFGTPCLWYDAGTGRCRHYDHRPHACRAFEVGSVDCRDARRRAGVPEIISSMERPESPSRLSDQGG